MLREFHKRSRHFLFDDLFINCHNHVSRQCMDIVRRKLMLVTMRTQRVKNRKDAKFVQDLSKTNKDVAPQKS